MKGGKRVNGEGIAILQDLDDCLGCYGCEAACRETNRYDFKEDWMRVIRRNPYYVDGRLRQHHLVFPVLDKCAACYAQDPNPLCVSGCTTKALKIGPLVEMVKEADGRHCLIYTA